MCRRRSWDDLSPVPGRQSRGYPLLRTMRNAGGGRLPGLWRGQSAQPQILRTRAVLADTACVGDAPDVAAGLLLEALEACASLGMRPAAARCHLAWGRSTGAWARSGRRASIWAPRRRCSWRCTCGSGWSVPRPRRGNSHECEEPDMARLTAITSKSQVAPEGHAAVDSIIGSRGALQGPFTMFLHAPEMAGRVAHLGAYVRFEGELDMRIRVLAAMTVARELDAVYVWGAQTGNARKQGVPESTITAIREKHSRGVPAEDAQIIDFTRRLLREHRVDPATFAALRQRLGEKRLLELTGSIGYYAMLAMTVNACELEAAPGAEVLKS